MTHNELIRYVEGRIAEMKPDCAEHYAAEFVAMNTLLLLDIAKSVHDVKRELEINA